MYSKLKIVCWLCKTNRTSISRISQANNAQCRFVELDSNFSINHTVSLKPRTLLPPTADSSKRSAVRYVLAILISKSLSYTKWADERSRGAKRQAVAEAVGEPPFSKDTRKARFFSLYCSLSRQPRILVLPLWSFHSRRHHISTYLRNAFRIRGY